MPSKTHCVAFAPWERISSQSAPGFLSGAIWLGRIFESEAATPEVCMDEALQERSLNRPQSRCNPRLYSPQQARRRVSRDSRTARATPHFFAQYDRLGDLSHRLALLPALLLQSQVGLFFGESHFALQNSFGAFHNFSRLQLVGKVRIDFLHARQFNLRAHQKPNR